MADRFPRRYRTLHLPDSIRRLESISYSGSSFLQTPSPTHQLSGYSYNGDAFTEDFANVFANLTVWMDANVEKCSFHAGFDKIHLYSALLRVFVDEILSVDALQDSVSRLESYITYLSTDLSGTFSPGKKARDGASKLMPRLPHMPSQNSSCSPRLKILRPDGNSLSPRVNRTFQQAKHHQQQPVATVQMVSPTKPPGNHKQRKRKKFIELTDHEEAILELALYMDELLQNQNPPRMNNRSKGQSTYTERWAVLSHEEKTAVLKRIKRKLSKKQFFTDIAAHVRLDSHPSNRHMQRMELSVYFSLVVICLHETIRRLGFFSAEIGAFAKKVLCEDTVKQFEQLFTFITAHQQQAQQQLQELKQSKAELQESIYAFEHDIQRLQAQNVRSLRMRDLEKEELAHLEREEQWHGHSKALILHCLHQLQRVSNIPTWLQLPEQKPCAVDDDAEQKEETSEHKSLNICVENTLVPSSGLQEYQRLPAGSAMFHFSARHGVVYIAHLIMLCRSFLHLHERRDVRDIMDSTSIGHHSSPSEGGSGGTVSLSQRSQAKDSLLEQHHSTLLPNDNTISHARNPMANITKSELYALRDINDTLRAIEVLYAEIGDYRDTHFARDDTTMGGRRISTQPLRPGYRQRHVSTQFSLIGSSRNMFLRSLAYCTVVATAFSSGESTSFLPAGSEAKLTAHNRGIIAEPPGSGQRLESASFRRLDVGSEPPVQPLLPLHKAILKLPKHIKDLLLLPLTNEHTFSANDSDSVVVSLSKYELLVKIRAIYNLVLANAYASSTGATSSATSEFLLISLSSPQPGTPSLPWRAEQFVQFIYSSFLDEEGGDIRSCDREFIRFFASIQLFLSKITLPTSDTTRSPSSAAQTSSACGSSSIEQDAIYFFAILTRLYYLHSDAGRRHMITPRVFTVFFYCQRVLLHVPLAKKHVQSGGSTYDIWSLAIEEFSTGCSSSSPFVLLESVKMLLTHLVSSVPKTYIALLLEEQFQVLQSRSTLATVSLITSVTPSTMGYENVRLVEAFILPLDVAIPIVVMAWMTLAEEVEHMLGNAMKAALQDDHGHLSFEEFAHVLITASGGNSPSLPSAITTSRLAHIYSLARTASATKDRDSCGDVGCHYLTQIVMEELDLLGIHERCLVLDFRSIQHALMNGNTTNPTYHHLLTGLIQPPHRNGTAAAIMKTWKFHHATMKDNFALAVQADNSVEGVRCWQSGMLRSAQMEKFVSVAPHETTNKRLTKRRNSIITGDPATTIRRTANVLPLEINIGKTSLPEDVNLSKDDLDIAWRTYHLLQLDHTKAHHLADQVRLRQQRLQLSNMYNTATLQPIQQSPTPIEPNKVEEERSQQPVSPKTPQRRSH